MKKEKLITLGLVLLICSAVLYLRINVLSLPVLNKVAKSEVYIQTYKEIKDKVDKEYASFFPEKRDALAQKFYTDYTKQNKTIIDEKIRQKGKEKKAFYQNANGYTYIFGIDSYYWLRLIDNLIHKGHIGEAIKDGQNYDKMVDMPIEKSLSRSMHIILGSFIYKIFGLFKLNVDYDIGFYLIPLLLSLLLAALTFFATKLLCQSNIAAFFAAIMINFSPLFLQRTMYEWLDTDIYNVLFPLLIFASFLYVFKYEKIYKKALGLLIFSLSCGLYASVWQGWWHIFDLLILGGLVFILNDYFSEGKDIDLFKENSFWLGLLFVSGIILVGLFNGAESFISFISEPKKVFFALKDIPRDNWPNVFLTVAELKKVSPYALANEVGGIIVFFVAVLGSIYLVLSKKILRGKGSGIGYFCLFIWLGVLYYTSLNAVRLALLLIVPLGLMFGITVDLIARWIFKISLKFSRKIHLAIVSVMALVMYIFVSSYIMKNLEVSYYKLPLMNDAWNNSLSFVKNNSGEHAVINSWWDYGHWFTSIAKRHVLFDGKTQNSPVAFWMAKVLTTSDEEKALGILRMLNISKNKAFDLLDSYGLSHARIMEILENVLKLPEPEARKYLKETLDDKKIDALMPLLYSDKMPEVYFIASYDMIIKIRAISHIANWDFKKGDIWIHLANNPFQLMDYLNKEYGYSKEEITNLLKDLSLLNEREALGWISRIDSIYPDSLSRKCKKTDNLLIFDNAMILDLSNYNAYIARGIDTDIGIPYSVVYLKDNALQENILSGSNAAHSVLLFKDGDNYRNIFLDKNLAKSMFSRMYFLKGETLKYFKKVREEKTPEGNSVFVYKVEWPK